MASRGKEPAEMGGRAPTISGTPGSSQGRIASIDIFRGFTLLAMTFANDMNDPDLGHVTDVPWWLNHMPPGVDGMTFVDAILPAFLFMAGMCIPLATARRIDQGIPRLRLWGHVLARTLGLLIIGLWMVNTYTFHPTAMVISPGLWELLLFIAVILIWNRYPDGMAGKRGLLAVLRGVGIGLFVFLAVVYRGEWNGQTTWMRTSWWGIPGLIGMAYVVAATAYLVFQQDLAAMVGVFSLLTAFNIGYRSGILDAIDFAKPYFHAGSAFGGLGSIAVAGVIVGMLHGKSSPVQAPARRLAWMMFFGCGLALSAFCLRPLGGIAKSAETPAWCLLSSAFCCWIYALLYYLADIRGWRRWAQYVIPAGSQPLLTFIMPHILYSLLLVLGISFLDTHLNVGLAGILRSLAIAFLIIWVSGRVAKAGVNLRL